MRISLVTALLVSLLALAGCGGSGNGGEGRSGFDSVISKVRGQSGKAREKRLLDLAKQEGGRLTEYTSLTPESAGAVAKAFERRYGVKVSVYQAKSGAVAQRVSQEAKARKRGADVIETSGEEMSALAREGVFVPYRPPAAAGLVEGSLQNGWIATRYNKFVVSWNTHLVPSGAQPRTLEDLADPRWRGRLAIEQGDAEWYRALLRYWTTRAGKSPAEARRLFQAIVSNARVISSHAVMAELLEGGGFAVAADNYLHLARDSIGKGAPVAVSPPVEPVFSRPDGIGLLETAKHPGAALLFQEWLLTDAQKVLRAHHLDPSRKGLDKQDTREVLIDPTADAQDAQKWTDRYDARLRGKKVEGDG